MLRNKQGSRLKAQGSRVRFFIISFLLSAFSFQPSAFSPSAFAEEDFVYNAKAKRNPFIPLVTSDGRLLKLDKEEEGSGGLAIEGIIYDKHGVSYAIVNGEVLKTADTVAGFQVLKIEEDRVIFIKDGQPLEVELKKEDR